MPSSRRLLRCGNLWLIRFFSFVLNDYNGNYDDLEKSATSTTFLVLRRFTCTLVGEPHSSSKFKAIFGTFRLSHFRSVYMRIRKIVPSERHREFFIFQRIFHYSACTRGMSAFIFYIATSDERLGVSWRFTLREINNERLDIVLDNFRFFLLAA